MKLAIHAASDQAIAKVRAFEGLLMAIPQTPIVTYHLKHAGIYARTITIPKDVVLTGAMIKVPTILVISGDVTVSTGAEVVRVIGTHVIPADAKRKQAFMAHADTTITMLFKTDEVDICRIEEYFTDEAELLFSRKGENVVKITGV
tara:strand:- start:23253 stop:23690 length:438 start_codon:yes stop_codon:yes gene_type:complete